MAMDAGVINALCPEFIAIHKPAVEKWVRASDKNMEYLIIECGVPYGINRKMYPIICTPLTLLAYKQRCKKYLQQTKSIRKQLSDIVSNTMQMCNRMESIKFSTFVKMFMDFGSSIL